MNFLIVDNTPFHLALMQKIVTQCYPDAKLYPADLQVFKHWSDVTDAVLTQTSDEENLVVFIDLGLESETMQSVSAGVEQAYSIRTLRPKATIIAYTQWPELAENSRHYAETFDDQIGKQRLSSFESIEEQRTYVKQIVESATRRRNGSKPNYKLRDSLGVRLIVAAFSDKVFDFLYFEVAKGWTDVEMGALTSGHSGAHILLIEGKDRGGTKQLIVKCARSRETIEAEIHLGDFLAEMGPLARLHTPVEQHIYLLPHNLGFYYKQVLVKGTPLLTYLRSHGYDDKAKLILNSVLDVEIECYSASAPNQFPTARPIDLLTLSVVDKGRAEDSLRFLGKANAKLERFAPWRDAKMSPNLIPLAILNLVNNWESLLSQQADLFIIAQHGDLNPGNVMVTSGSNVTLIDFARKGRWPVGYDLARLTTMLKLRLTDSSDCSDWVENRIGVWCQTPFVNIHTRQHENQSSCAAASYCESVFSEFLESRSNQESSVIARGYKLSTLWDLIKVLSYSDLSIFKRLWALHSAYILAEELSLIATNEE